MAQPLIRQGEGPAAAIPLAYELRQRQAEQLAEVLRSLEEPLPPRIVGTAGGDTRRLRGLAAIARGSSGATPGTDPLRALLAKERRNGRRAT